MRKLRTAVLAGIAALGVAGTAVAAGSGTHVMAVDLPDGSVARIEYKGDVAPKVKIEPPAGLVPVRFVVPLDPAPFAVFDRIFADLDRQAAAMVRQARALSLSPVDSDGKPDPAALAALPAGTVSYRLITTGDGGRVCSRSWQWTSQGPDRQPKLVSASAGDCGPDGPAASQPGVTTAKASPAVPAARTVTA